MLWEAAHKAGHRFKLKPFIHQLEAFLLSKDRRAYALFMEMGTGKTKIVVDNIAYLYDSGQIDAALVFANKGSYRNWTTTEIPEHMPDHVRYFATYWDSGAKGELLESYNTLYDRSNDLKIFVMNIEALSYARGIEAAVRFAKTFRCMGVVDESTTIKSGSANRTKNAVKLSRYLDYRRILTGSPVTKSPLDLFTQCEFLEPGILGFGSYFSFRNHFADMVEKKFGNKRPFKQIVGYKHIDELRDILGQFAYRVLKDECLDLPPKVYETYDVELTDEQKRIYKELVKKSIAELDAGEITAVIMLTKLLRLHQVVCGSVVLDDGTEVEIEDNRLPALMELLEETDKVIIWATYTRDIRRIAREIAKTYGEESVATYYGATKADDRELARVNFQNPDSPVRFFVGNPSVGGYGTTLTAASTVIYYSNSYDLEKRMQSEDRAHRIGQTKSVTYIDLVARGTVDEKIMTALRSKREVAAEVLGDPLTFKDWLL